MIKSPSAKFQARRPRGAFLLTLIKPGIDDYAESKSEPTSALLNTLERDTRSQMPHHRMLTGSQDERVDRVLLTIRDGVFMLRKR